MKVLLTGASGFVGLDIIDALLDKKFDVIAYIRSGFNDIYLKNKPVEIIRGEPGDFAALSHVMKGCDDVIHTAGNTGCDKKDWNALEKTNVFGTQAVVNAAASGVKRLVYTSTTSTAHVAAVILTKGRGERYILAEHNRPIRDFIEAVYRLGVFRGAYLFNDNNVLPS